MSTDNTRLERELTKEVQEKILSSKKKKQVKEDLNQVYESVIDEEHGENVQDKNLRDQKRKKRTKKRFEKILASNVAMGRAAVSRKNNNPKPKDATKDNLTPKSAREKIEQTRKQMQVTIR